MKSQGLWTFYSRYLPILIAASGFAVNIDRDYFVSTAQAWIIVLLVLVLLPLLVFFAIHSSGSLSRYSRVFAFWFFGLLKVETFAAIGLILFSLLTGRFLYNLLVNHYYQGEEIFTNVFILNMFLVIFMVLVLGGKFTTRQPNALLIQQSGHPEIYLCKDGVLRLVPDPQTFGLSGYYWVDVVRGGRDEFDSYPVGRSLESIYEARLLRDIEGTFWIVLDDVRRKIPDAPTLEFIRHGNPIPAEGVSDQELRAITEAKSLRSVHDINY